MTDFEYIAVDELEEKTGGKRSVWKSGKMRFSLCCLICFGFIALFAGFLANEKPLILKRNGKTTYPFLNNEKGLTYYELQEGSYDFVIWPLIPYSPGKSDRRNEFANADYVGPFDYQIKSAGGVEVALDWRFSHWLGTGKKGEDILAGLIHGTRYSLAVGGFSALLAGLLGILIGGLAGYYRNDGLQLSKLELGAWIATLISFLYHCIYLGTYGGWMMFMVIIVFTYVIHKKHSGAKVIRIPLDALVLRTIEIFGSIPRLLILFAVLGVILTQSSISGLVIIMGFTSWLMIARITRAEFIKLGQEEFIQAAKALGLDGWRMIFNHLLRNSLPVITVAVSFTVSGAILLESSLSFLGIGVPEDIVTWGSIISSSREQFSAWWLFVFPGLMLVLTVFSINTIADTLRMSYKK